MSSTSDIKNKARSVYTRGTDVYRTCQKTWRSVSESKGWWKAIAANTLRAKFDEVAHQGTSVSNKVTYMDNRFKSMANAVQKAEEEQRRKERDLARARALIK